MLCTTSHATCQLPPDWFYRVFLVHVECDTAVRWHLPGGSSAKQLPSHCTNVVLVRVHSGIVTHAEFLLESTAILGSLGVLSNRRVGEVVPVRGHSEKYSPSRERGVEPL